LIRQVQRLFHLARPPAGQGKPDTQPWKNESPAAELRGGKWTQGDRTSWEEAVKQRQLAQNEYQRIGQ